MAFLPNGPDGSKWQVTSIDNLVYLIENPGMEEEKVHFKWDLTNSMGVSKAIDDGWNYTEFLNDAQRALLWFWIGYFYAHFCRR